MAQGWVNTGKMSFLVNYFNWSYRIRTDSLECRRFPSRRHIQADNAEATEGSGPCPNTREWTCLSKLFSVNRGLEGHTDTFEILRVIKILFRESVFLSQKLFSDPIFLHDVSFAFLLSSTRRTLLQNDPLRRLILWIFRETIAVGGREMRGYIPVGLRKMGNFNLI